MMKKTMEVRKSELAAVRHHPNRLHSYITTPNPVLNRHSELKVSS